MNSEDRLKKLANSDEPYLYVDSNNLDEDIEFIKNRNIKNIMLNSYYGYNIDHIDWLSYFEDFPLLEDLTICPSGIKSFSYEGLKYLSNIKNLTIQNDSKDIIDLAANTNLQQLYTLDSRFLRGLETLINLESLVLTKPHDNILTCDVFDNLKNLNYLCLSNRSFKEGLGFLKNTNLQRLMICYSRKLSLEGIRDLDLTWLEIDSCKNIEHADEIFKILTLKELRLINSITVESLESIKALSDLEILIILGSSYLKDGNLDAATGRYRHFSFDDKRHYNIKFEEFKKSFLKK